MIHAIEDQQKHLEMLQKFEPHFQGIYSTMMELKNTQDVMFATFAVRTAQLWINSCVVTSLKQDEIKMENKSPKDAPRIVTLNK